MSRKRKSDQEPSPETPTAVADPPAVEPPAAEPKAEGKSFAERVGKRPQAPDPDPFPFANDAIAGVRLFQSKQDRQMAIKFGQGRPEDKPSQAVIDRMKEAGFRWNQADRIWALRFTPETARRAHIEAENLYQEVRQMIRQEKGIEASPDVPF
jgi:hypothetical protein